MNAGLAAARRAVAARPADPERHFLLGLALRASGADGAAADAYRAAIGRDPGHVKALNNLGNLLVARGEASEAERCLRAAVQAQPLVAQSHNNLGLALDALLRTAEAEACFRRAIALRPGYARAHYNLGMLLGRHDRVAEAEAAFRRALAAEPDLAEAQDQLGRCLLWLRRPAEALAALLKADAKLPLSPTLPHDIGLACCELDRYDEAEAWLRRAVARTPAASHSWIGLATVALRRGDRKAALDLVERAIAASPSHGPGHGNARFQRALLLLSRGEYAAGFAEYEWRWHASALAGSRREFPQPLWLGQSALDGRTILLHAEQGFGDTLQFCRYVPMVARAGGRVVLEVSPELRRLMQGLPGVAELVAAGETLPAFDLHCPLLSLPLAMKTSRETIPPPASFPAIQAIAPRPDSVGFAWAGNPGHVDDHRRSIPLARFARLLDLPGIRPVVLQKARRDGDDALLSARDGLDDAGSAAGDFADTARAIAALGLVVTVDSAVAHLAGAMGRPVWVLLAHTCDWRWHADPEPDETRTPWYPTARLFRQRRVGDWDEVLDRVAGALAAGAAAREEAAGASIA